MLATSRFAGPLIVTITYVLVYYALQVNQLRVKGRMRREHKARGERFDRYFNTDRTMLAADRYAGNMLDHMPTFLLLLWLDATFVGTNDATVAGGIYVASRIVYPFLMGPTLGASVPSRILFATVAGYGVVAYFCLRLLLVALAGAQ
jgi:hypothetical protein